MLFFWEIYFSDHFCHVVSYWFSYGIEYLQSKLQCIATRVSTFWGIIPSAIPTLLGLGYKHFELLRTENKTEIPFIFYEIVQLPTSWPYEA